MYTDILFKLAEHVLCCAMPCSFSLTLFSSVLPVCHVICLLSFFPFVDPSFSLYRRSRANAIDLLVTSLLRGAALHMVLHGSSL